MVFGVLWGASGVDVMGKSLVVRKAEEEVEVRLIRREELWLSSAVPLAKLCSRDRRSTKTPVLLRQAGTTGAMETMSRRYYCYYCAGWRQLRGLLRGRLA